MADPRDAIIDGLNAAARFPSHGCLIDADGDQHLLFPVEQATAAALTLRQGGHRSLSGERWLRAAAFRQSLIKVLLILDQIAAQEHAILTAPRLEDASGEEWVEAVVAQEQIGLSVEIFFIYFRILADRLALALTFVLSDHPESLWKDYPKMVQMASTGRPALRLGDGGTAFYQAVLEHQAWFELLRAPSGGGKGIRDAILHRPIQTTVSLEVSDTGEPTQLFMTLMSSEGDVPRFDVFGAISEVATGLCAFLSALPRELWGRDEFMGRDFVIDYAIPWPHALRYFPVVADLRS